MTQKTSKAKQKKDAQAFYEGVADLMTEIRAVETTPKNSDHCTEWMIATDCGPLQISVQKIDKDELSRDIYCRYRFPKMAAARMGGSYRLNRASGKWNFHYSKFDGERSYISCLADFSSDIKNRLDGLQEPGMEPVRILSKTIIGQAVAKREDWGFLAQGRIENQLALLIMEATPETLVKLKALS